MPFDSDGTFTRLHNWEEDRKNDVEIVADRHDEEDDGFADALSMCVLKDGRTSLTGDLKMGGFKIKNLASGTSAGDAVTKEQFDNLQTQINARCVYKVVDSLPDSPESGIFYFVKEQS